MINSEVIKKQAVVFGRARSNLILVVVFTVANLILTAFESGFFLLFSATMPTIIAGVVPPPIGIILALGSVAIYFICWLMSKKYRAFILVALILFSIDTILFLVLSLGFVTDFELSYLIEIAFHAWIMFYLITGTIAWVKLMKVTPEELKAVKEETENKLANDSLKEIVSEDDENKE